MSIYDRFQQPAPERSGVACAYETADACARLYRQAREMGLDYVADAIWDAADNDIGCHVSDGVELIRDAAFRAVQQ